MSNQLNYRTDLRIEELCGARHGIFMHQSLMVDFVISILLQNIDIFLKMQ